MRNIVYQYSPVFIFQRPRRSKAFSTHLVPNFNKRRCLMSSIITDLFLKQHLFGQTLALSAIICTSTYFLAGPVEAQLPPNNRQPQPTPTVIHGGHNTTPHSLPHNTPNHTQPQQPLPNKPVQHHVTPTPVQAHQPQPAHYTTPNTPTQHRVTHQPTPQPTPRKAIQQPVPHIAATPPKPAPAPVAPPKPTLLGRLTSLFW